MIYAVLNVPGEYFPVGYLFGTWDEFHKATFSPEVETVSVVDLSRVCGKTYAEKKDFLRQKAIDFQSADEGALSYGEIMQIMRYFHTNGRRYGLLREFRENGIC